MLPPPPPPAPAPSAPGWDSRSSLAPVSVAADSRQRLIAPQADLSHLLDELTLKPRSPLPKRALVPIVAAVLGILGLAFLSWKVAADEQFYSSLAADHAREATERAEADRPPAPAAAMDAEADTATDDEAAAEESNTEARTTKRGDKARKRKRSKRRRARRSSRQRTSDEATDWAPSGDVEPPRSAAKRRKAKASEQAPPFSRDSARAALSAAAGAAQSCRASGAASTRAVVSVTFAPSGRATTAVVSGGSYAGTRAGSCIAQAFRRARVSPFAGSPVTVRKTVRLP